MEVHGVGPVTEMFCFMPKAYLENSFIWNWSSNTSGFGRPFIVKRNLYIYRNSKTPFSNVWDSTLRQDDR